MNKELVSWKKAKKLNLMEQKELEIMEEVKAHWKEKRVDLTYI